jgi:Protein of unknown function (DUF1499)
MRTAVTLLLLLIGVAGTVFGVAFWKNDLPWHLPPGRMARVLHYVTRNVADTNAPSPFPELRTRAYPGVGPDQLFSAAERAVGKLGWSVLQRDKGDRVLRAVVTTAILKFQDDIEIAVKDAAGSPPELRVRSVSRVGKGDLGANTAHILALYRAMDGDLPWAGTVANAK